MATSTIAASPALIRAEGDSRSLRRFEDGRFVTGAGRYVGNQVHDRELTIAVLRSPHAHARIRSIDTSRAPRPGIHGVFTAADLDADGIGPLPCIADLRDGRPLVVPPRPALARDRVRHVGEPVAFVVAESLSLAEEALEDLEVEYEPIPPAVDPEAALLPGAAEIWPEAPGNEAFRFRRGDAALTEAAFRDAPHVVALDLVNNRVAAASIETRAAVGRWHEASGRFELHVSGASVHDIRADLVSVFGVAPDRVDVVAPDVGGGFGMKNVLYPEYVMALWAAKRLRRPVRWTASRMDDFLAGAHGRASVTHARLALDRDGRFLGLDVRTIADLGAYLSPHGPGAATLAPSTALGGVYDIPAVTFDVRGAFTNTVPVDAYRGAGKPEVNYIVERLIDVAAARLGMDRVELRRRNVVARFPHGTAMGQTIDCGDFLGNIDRALDLADRAAFPERRREAAARGRLRGQGIACFLETARGRPNEEARVAFADDGSIELVVGTQSNGQGHETSFVQLVADHLGLPLERFRLVQGDTRVVASGGGHGGARSLHLGGTALLLAADDMLQRGRRIAAGLLQADPDALVYERGAFSTLGTDLASTIDLAALARSSREAGTPEALDGHAVNICDLITFPSGCHVAEVEIDPETGHTDLVSYVAVDDFGTLVNPLMTEGQVQGGIAQGIGQAMCEGIRYDPDSGQLASATFMDYALPRGEDLPDLDIRFVELPTRANPIGAKGAGQAGAIAAPPTIVNAVVDALSHLGIEHLDMPLVPARIWAAIRAGERPRNTG